MPPSISWTDPTWLQQQLARMGIRADAATGHVPSEPAPKTLEAFEPPAGDLEARVEAFLAWAVTQTDALAVFICDEDGMCLFQHLADPELVAASSSISRVFELVQQATDELLGAHLTVHLRERGSLWIVRSVTSIGPLVLGVTTRRVLSNSQIAALQTGLIGAARDDGPARSLS